MDLEKIGKFIKERRQEIGLTQKQLADMFGITAKAVSKWECGQNAPDISLLNKLSETLHVTINEILNGCKENEIPKANLIDKTTIKKLRIKTMIEIILLILIIVISSLSIFLGRYYAKNYNKCNVYKIYTQSTELNSTGYLLHIDNKLTIILDKLLYTGKVNEKIIDYEISLLINNKLVLSRKNSDNKIRTLKEVLKEQQISSTEEIDQSIIKNKNVEQINIALNINYKDKNNKSKTKKFIFNIKDYYSNR